MVLFSVFVYSFHEFVVILIYGRVWERFKIHCWEPPAEQWTPKPIWLNCLPSSFSKSIEMFPQLFPFLLGFLGDATALLQNSLSKTGSYQTFLSKKAKRRDTWYRMLLDRRDLYVAQTIKPHIGALKKYSTVQHQCDNETECVTKLFGP